MNQKPEEVEIKSCPELLPCPFCGGRPEIFNIENDIDYPRDFGGSVIECKDCHASTKVFFGEKIGLNEAWNHRTPTQSNEDGRKLRVLDKNELYELLYKVNPCCRNKIRNQYIKAICETFGQPSIPTKTAIEEVLYDLSHSEYGDAKSQYDLTYYKDRELIAEAIHSLLKGEARTKILKVTAVKQK